MIWDLPLSVEIDGQEHPIRNECDYRVVLDVISALNDNDLTDNQKIECALYVFYEDLENITNYEVAVNEMMRIINNGECGKQNENKPQIMDWEKDFNLLTPPINRVLGYDIRHPKKYTHWYTFLGGYMEIGECTFQTVISIRSKRAKGKKLENWEREFARENADMIKLPTRLTKEEQEELNAEW